MDLGLDGQVAWVTGASSGLGLASSLALAREGATVAISARGEDGLALAAATIKGETGADVLTVPFDLTDSGSISAAHQLIQGRLGPVRILVVSSGGPPPGGIEDVDRSVLQLSFDLLCGSIYELTTRVLPDMRNSAGGVLIYLTSSATKEPIPGLLVSNMMRAAVLGFAKSIATELGPTGIRVCCVAPGRIATDRVRALDERAALARGLPLADVQAASKATIPLRRYGRPEEFGSAVAFLASERASYITGTTLVVDGGKLVGILS